MLDGPRICFNRIYDSAEGNSNEGKLKWWHIEVENRKRWRFSSTSPAEDSEIRFWLINKSTYEIINLDGYKGRWQTESEIVETESKRTLRVGVPNVIPIIRVALKDERVVEGLRKGGSAYITERGYFISEKQPCSLNPGEYIMLLKLYAGSISWMEGIFLINIPKEGLEDFELKRIDKKKLKSQAITKEEFHKILDKAAQPIKKSDSK